MLEEFRWLPESASTLSGRVDALYFFLVAVSLVFSVGIAVTVVLFSIRYRKRKNVRPAAIEGSLPLELVWSLIPLSLMMVMFTWGARLYFEMSAVPADGMDVYVTAKQWMWKLQHPDGQREINTLHVPVDTPVRLTMISEDVIHSFFVPAFRMKRDVLPGRYSHAWFEATQTGEYDLFCAEYCGTQHSGMIGKVRVLEQEEYERWLSDSVLGETPAQLGLKLYEQLRCDTCHDDTAAARGPVLLGRFGAASTLQDGSEVLLEEDYLRESLLRPLAKQVAGWEPLMPTYAGQLSEEQILQITAYLQSSSAAPAAGAAEDPR